MTSATLKVGLRFGRFNQSQAQISMQYANQSSTLKKAMY